MKTSVLIPARMAATRFPGKPLSPILGKPMIQWVYERCALAAVDAVIVATDSDDIMQAVLDFGGRAVMTRTDHENGTQRIAEVAQRLDSDVVVNVQGDEPAIHPDVIDAVIAPFQAGSDLPMATLAEPLQDHADILNPNVVKVVCDAKGRALYFSRAPIPYVKHPYMASPAWPEPAELRHWQRHVGVYAFRRDFLLAYVRQPSCDLERLEGLEQLRALYMGARIQVVASPKASVGVDLPSDVARVEAILRREGVS